MWSEASATVLYTTPRNEQHDVSAPRNDSLLRVMLATATTATTTALLTGAKTTARTVPDWHRTCRLPTFLTTRCGVTARWYRVRATTLVTPSGTTVAAVFIMSSVVCHRCQPTRHPGGTLSCIHLSLSLLLLLHGVKVQPKATLYCHRHTHRTTGNAVLGPGPRAAERSMFGPLWLLWWPGVEVLLEVLLKRRRMHQLPARRRPWQRPTR